MNEIILEKEPENEPSKVDLIDIRCFKSNITSELLIRHTTETKSPLQHPYQIPDPKWKETTRNIN